MRIPRIYHPGKLLAGETIMLETNAAHHLTRVLRMQDSEKVLLFNGEGGEFIAHLRFQGKQVAAYLEIFTNRDTDSSLQITLLQGISKGERMDFVMQKAVELGVSKIIPVICQRTVVNVRGERSEKKIQHWQGIIINACEQSGRTSVPLLMEPMKLIEGLQIPGNGIKLTLNPSASISLNQITPDCKNISLLIGPEGGLDDQEVRQAQANGFLGVRLGPRILRTETAALAAIAILQSTWGDLS